MRDKRKVEIYVRDKNDQSIRILSTNDFVPIPEVGDIFTIENHRFKGTGENQKKYKVLEREYSYKLEEFKPSEAKHGISTCSVLLRCEKISEG